MSEDEYDALSELEKAEIDRHRLEIKKQRLQRFIHLSCCFAQTQVFAANNSVLKPRLILYSESTGVTVFLCCFTDFYSLSLSLLFLLFLITASCTMFEFYSAVR